MSLLTISANDRNHEVAPGTSLAEFLDRIGLKPQAVVVERNGEAIKRSGMGEVALADGDRLIIVKAVAGGADFPSVGPVGQRRQARLRDARLYVITDARRSQGDLDSFLEAVCGASADVVQLRDKTATEDELRSASDVFRRVCDLTGALFVLNDLPGLAVQVGADGVHLGQGDVSPDHTRRIVGPDVVIGRSTHSAAEIDAAANQDVDYIAVGPVYDTPTKPDREGIGLGPLGHASASATCPWFAIGGIDASTVDEVLGAGARRIAVVRAVTEATDAGEACWALRRKLAPIH